jgi:hypothetical protein
MAEQLGWHVVYRTMWNPAFPTLQTDYCFPNVARKKLLNSTRKNDKHDPLWQFLLVHDGGGTSYLHQVYDALTYNDLEPGRTVVSDSDEANEVYLDWIKGLGEKAKTIAHMAYPLQENHVDKLVESLRNPNSPVRVLSLEVRQVWFYLYLFIAIELTTAIAAFL